MRILFLDTSSEPDGGPRVFLAAGRALAARGYEVSFACLVHSAVARNARAMGLETVPVADGAPFRARTRVLREAFQDRYVDVAFVSGDSNDLAAAVASRLAGRGAVVRRFAAGERPQSTWRMSAARRFAPATYLLTAIRADTVAPLRGATQVVGEIGVDIPAPTYEHASPPAGNQTMPRLACLASRDTWQGALNVLRAVALLAERHPRMRLTVGGSASRLDELRLYAAALRLSGHVQFASGEADALRSAQMAWVVGDGDEAALGCLNVMARGIPVFARHTDITAHFISASQGLLFPSLDPPAMAAEVATLLAEPERRERMGEAARSRVERDFSERVMTNGFEQATRSAREHRRELAREQARGLA